MGQSSRRKKKFYKDFGIYTIGAIGTRFITFMMVPLYTYFIDKPSDYGYYDLCISVCMLLIPITTLQLREGAFRFLLDNHDPNSQDETVYTIVRILGANIMALLSLSFIIYLAYDIYCLVYVVTLLVVMTIHEVIAQTCRGLGNNKAYVVSSLINATAVGLLSIVLVAALKMGIIGIFLANILSRVLTISYIEKHTHVLKRMKRMTAMRQVSSTLRSALLRYCLPMIPLTMCWNFTVNSSRFFIKYFLGDAANGIFAVSIRFSMVLQTLSIIFYQTWQETSITQFNSPDRDAFFSKVFYNFFYLMVLLFVSFTFVLKVNYFWLIDAKYAESLTYVYPLSIAAIFNALSSAYFELGYQCSKETKRAIPGIVLVFLLNILFGTALTPAFGLWGVAVTSIISYFFLSAYRFVDTRRYFRISYSNLFILPTVIMFVSAIPFYYSTHYWQDIVYMVLSVLTMLIFAPNEIKGIVKSVPQKFRR